MPDSQIDEIKSKIDIVQIIGEHVQLNKSGSNFKGLCPFHQEKTPSFMVSPELQIYKCFGCSESGDVFTFLQKYEQMDFSEALHFLAEKTGVKLASFTQEDNSKAILYELNALSGKFYNFLLTSHKIGNVALNYLLEDRKISMDSIKTFNLGYAPHNTNSLSEFLIKKKKFKLQDLQKAGLVFISKSGSHYDRFAGRIIFPISDHRGNVIALAGRQLPPGNPRTGKYINSPETPIYHKSNSLYGLNITKDFIKKESFAVVVEGEIDVIASFQIGIKNIVAIKGSAFTPDQARLLARYTKDVVLALDSDFAGVNANIRGIKILDDAGFDIRVAKLGIYKDPDDAAKANPEFLKTAITTSVAVWDFIIDSAFLMYDKNTTSGITKIGKFLTPILAQISNKIVQDRYIKKLANLLDVQTSSVSQEIAKITLPEKQPTQNEPENSKIHQSRRELLEERLLGLLIKEDILLLKKQEIFNLISSPFAKRLLEEFTTFRTTKKTISLKTFAQYLPKELLDNFALLIFAVGQIDDKSIKHEINETYKQLAIMDIRGKLVSWTKSGSQKAAEVDILSKNLKDFNSDNFERIIS